MVETKIELSSDGKTPIDLKKMRENLINELNKNTAGTAEEVVVTIEQQTVETTVTQPGDPNGYTCSSTQCNANDYLVRNSCAMAIGGALADVTALYTKNPASGRRILRTADMDVKFTMQAKKDIGGIVSNATRFGKMIKAKQAKVANDMKTGTYAGVTVKPVLGAVSVGAASVKTKIKVEIVTQKPSAVTAANSVILTSVATSSGATATVTTSPVVQASNHPGVKGDEDKNNPTPGPAVPMAMAIDEDFFDIGIVAGSIGATLALFVGMYCVVRRQKRAVPNTQSGDAETLIPMQAHVPRMYRLFMSGEGTDEITPLPSTPWEDLDPGHGLCEELKTNKALRAKVPRIATVAADVKFKVDSLIYDDNLPAECSNDHMAALVAYTHDNKSGKQAGNLYFELNTVLRERGEAARAELMKAWARPPCRACTQIPAVLTM